MRVGCGIWSLFFVALSYIHQDPTFSPTALSRLDVLHALAHGRLSIDAYEENTPDKAVYHGHYYSDKAPGTVALALIPFASAARILSLGGADLDSKDGWLFSSWLACAGSIGIITSLGALAMFAWLSKYVSAKWAILTTVTVFLGAAPLPYSTMMFSHSSVIGLLAIAIWALGIGTAEASIGDNEVGKRMVANWRDMIAGFACGWVLASEYSAGLVVAALLLWVISNRRQGAFYFCAFAIPPLLLIPAYSWACFGDPWTLAYSYQASFPPMKEGIYAIKWPDPETALKLLFSPARGLFFWTPFFIMAGFGYWYLIRKSQRLFWYMYVPPLLQVVIISGRVWDWPAGPTWGPRLLSPMIPLLALPCAYGVKRFPWLGLPLAAYSLLVTTLATLTNACPPFQEHPYPLLDFNIPILLKGTLSPNLGLVVGLRPYASIGLYYGILGLGSIWLWRNFTKENNKAVANVIDQDAAEAHQSDRIKRATIISQAF